MNVHGCSKSSFRCFFSFLTQTREVRFLWEFNIIRFCGNTVNIFCVCSVKEVSSSTAMMGLPVKNLRGMPNCVIRSTSLYLTAQNETGGTILWQHRKVFREGIMSEQMVQKLLCEFCEGRCDVHDLPQGQLNDSITLDSMTGVWTFINYDGRLMTYELEMLIKNEIRNTVLRIWIKHILTQKLYL